MFRKAMTALVTLVQYRLIISSGLTPLTLDRDMTGEDESGKSDIGKWGSWSHRF
jgi:hypothetical protein